MSVISNFDFDGFEDVLLIDPLAGIVVVAMLIAIAISGAAWPMTAARRSPVERLVRRRHFGI
jgi:hypothetical protein